MDLVFDNTSNDPQTHVFIIGVGGYPFLKDGEQEKQQLLNQVGLLRQLTSPPRSAIAFKDAMLEIHQSSKMRFAKPLGSIELLISPSKSDPQPGKPGEIFEPATREGIEEAYDKWKQRCNAHEDNVAIFFFSGHGVEKADHYLLAEDFGKSPNNPWMQSFNFDKTRRAFHAVKAKTQCFFIDSCRQITGDMLQKDLPDVPLDVPTFLEPDCTHNLTIKAAAHNETAHGPKRKPSYFTQVLLKAFEGYGASKENGIWSVTTGNIATRTDTILGIIRPDKVQKQRFPTNFLDSTEILIHQDAPLAHLSVECNPKNACKHAQFQCKDINSGDVISRDPNTKLVWDLEIPSGLYKISAAFPNAEFNNTNENISVVPPSSKEILKCQ
ncbi:caspase family protein [Flagellimonas eckloniae]|uniref:Peptidase C14 caspase domain-containing protein n=1 Tax=Flagellimonas eckloniae TaxID=346185 RepID=A0A0Q1HD34_9FLAO|nr:caspase family protein [Allomuricauda eckloniae]KQC31335.1 hypothetical protein AAY42_16670 [Allomuricauda eckloniae]